MERESRTLRSACHRQWLFLLLFFFFLFDRQTLFAACQAHCTITSACRLTHVSLSNLESLFLNEPPLPYLRHQYSRSIRVTFGVPHHRRPASCFPILSCDWTPYAIMTAFSYTIYRCKAMATRTSSFSKSKMRALCERLYESWIKRGQSAAPGAIVV